MKNALLIWDDGSQAYCLDFRCVMSEEDVETVKQHLPVETYLSFGNFHRFVLDSTFDLNNKKQFVFARIILDTKILDQDAFDTIRMPIDGVIGNEHTASQMSELVKRMEKIPVIHRTKKPWFTVMK